jgi:hypothetical protein
MPLSFLQESSPHANSEEPVARPVLEPDGLPTSGVCFPLLKKLLIKLQALVTDELLNARHLEGKIVEYAGFYLDATKRVPQSLFDSTGVDNGKNPDTPNSPASTTGQPNKSLHKLTYYILFRVFPEIKYLAKGTKNYTKPHRVDRFNDLWKEVNEIRLAAWKDTALGITIRRIAKNGEEEPFPAQKLRIEVTSAVDATNYHHTINSHTYSYSSGINSDKTKIAVGLAAAINQSGEPVLASAKGNHYFVVANVAGTAFTNQVDPQLLLTSIDPNPVIPTSSVSPPVKASDNTDKRLYLERGTVIHHLFVAETFDADGSSNVPLHYYLLSNSETPYFEQWLTRRKSIPFWAHTRQPNADGVLENLELPPRPTSGFTKLAITPTDTNFFYNIGLSKENFNRYARIVSAGVAPANAPTPPAGTRYFWVNISGFKTVKDYVTVRDKTTQDVINNILSGSNLARESGGDIRINGDKHRNHFLFKENTTEPYFPNYKNKENFDRTQIQKEVKTNRYYVEVLKDTFTSLARVDVPVTANVTLNDLINPTRRFPIYGSNSGDIFIEWPGANVATTHMNELPDFSSLTLGMGIDVGHTAATDEDLNEFLSNATTKWGSLTQAQKNIMYSMIGVKDQADLDKRAAIFIANRPLFDSLDENLGAKNFPLMVVAMDDIIKTKYSKQQRNNLKTATPKLVFEDSDEFLSINNLNVYELYAMLTLTWNLTG